MPTLNVKADTPTAVTICWAAAADETSRATIRFCLGSYIVKKCKRFGACRLVFQGCHHLRLGGLGSVGNHIQAHALQSPGLKVEHARGVVREVNNASRDDWPPVIDAHHYRPPV